MVTKFLITKFSSYTYIFIHFHNCTSHKPLKLIELCVNWSIHHLHVFIHLNCLIWLLLFVVFFFFFLLFFFEYLGAWQICKSLSYPWTEKLLSVLLLVLVLLLLFLIKFNYEMLMRKIALEKQHKHSININGSINRAWQHTHTF